MISGLVLIDNKQSDSDLQKCIVAKKHFCNQFWLPVSRRLFYILSGSIELFNTEVYVRFADKRFANNFTLKGPS